MKRIIFLIVCICFIAPAYTQYQLSHGTEKYEYGKSVRSLRFDEAYILGGQTNYYYDNTGFDATLLKTRYDGSIMWSKVYGYRKAEIFNSVRPINPKEDKGYVCLGTTNSVGKGGNDFLFVRTNPDGTPNSAFTYGEEANDVGQCIQVIKDENSDEPILIMIGSTNSYSNESKMYIIKTRLDGSFLNGVIVGYKGNQYGFWIEQTRDGGFIAVGANDYACGMDSIPNLDIFVAKLKPNLDLEWTRTIGGGPERPYGDIGYSVKEIEEGYIVTGITQSFGVGFTNDAFLLKLDHGGGFQWLRNYGYEAFDGGLDVLNEESTGVNHQYVLTGLSMVNNSYYAMLLATDYDGNVMWQRGYGIEGHEIGYEMDRTLNHGYVFTGLETSFGAGLMDIYHVVTNDIGDSYCPQCEIDLPIKSRKHRVCIYREGFSKHIETGVRQRIESWDIDYKTSRCDPKNMKSTESEFGNIDQNILNLNDLTMNPTLANELESIKNPENINQNELTVYPNPANELVRVQYPDNFKLGNLNVYNNIGQLVLTKVLHESNSTEISLNKLENGVYMISVINEKGESISSNLLISK